MLSNELLPHLFRSEYRKIVSVLSQLFGMEHIEVAEDITSETFLLATEVWGLKGLPENPTAWLYVVAKNKTKNYIKRHQIFAQKISPGLKQPEIENERWNIDLSNQNMNDSQLAMMFAVCNPCISAESQIGLALNLLCGFGIDEIANAFLTNKETVYKRLQRAKDKLKSEKIKIEQPSILEIQDRLPNVLTTLYLLFNEGYYSSTQNKAIQKELCLEAMRLNYALVENENTNIPSVNALLSLMCFHSSRLEARINQMGELVLYEDQDTSLWNTDLIRKGEYYLKKSSQGNKLSKYHLEAGIAYWHTKPTDPNKWEHILQLYNYLIQLEYSPITALNRTFALANAHGKKIAIVEAEKLNLKYSHLYYSLLGNLYTDIDNVKAQQHYQKALTLAHSTSDKVLISRNIFGLKIN